MTPIQLKFLRYIQKPRKRSDVMQKFPKNRKNHSIYDLEFSRYFDRVPNDCFQINDAGMEILKENSSKKFSFIPSLFEIILQAIKALLGL